MNYFTETQDKSGAVRDLMERSGSERSNAQEGLNISAADRLRYLRVVLVVVGLIFIFGIYTLGVVWPSGWAWGHGHSHYLMMILGVYATLGVFLLLASKNPTAHTSLIWFTVGSSVVHAVIMGGQALTDPAERGHLVGDVPILLAVAIALAALMPRGRVGQR